MRILLVAEGEHELHGALEILMRRLVPVHLRAFEIVTLQMSDRSIGHVSGKGDRLTRRILSCMRKATEMKCDALVLLIDEDGDRDRRRQIRLAQDSTLFPVQRAVGLAIITFDAWMLADETALTKTLGHPIATQPAPEQIGAPKEIFKRLLESGEQQLKIAEAYAAIAASARLEILMTRCADGFAPFAGHLQKFH